MRATTDTWKTKIKFAKVNEQVLNEELRERNLEMTGTTEARAVRLEKSLVEGAKGAKMAECDCGGKSPASMPRCPYCGDTAEVEGLPAAQAAGKEDELALRAARGLQPSADEVQDLDARVSRTKQFALNYVASAWDLGNELLAMHERKLWMHRRDEAGVPRYRTFEMFAQTELGIPKTSAYKLMEVVRAFTREQLLHVGVTKLGIVLQLPEGPERQQLLAQAGSSTVASLKGGVAAVLGTGSKGGAPADPNVVEAPDAEEEDEDDDQAEPAATGPVAPPAAGAAKPAEVAPKKETRIAFLPHPLEPLKPGEEVRPGGTNDPLGALPPKAKLMTVTMRAEPFQMKFFAKGSKKDERAFDMKDLPNGSHTFEDGSRVHVKLRRGDKGIYALLEFVPAKN